MSINQKLNSANDTLKVQIRSLGEVEFRFVSMIDVRAYIDLLGEGLSDRAFVAKVLLRQIRTPGILLTDIENIPDLELKELAQAFVEKERGLFKNFTDNSDFFSSFREAIIADEKERAEKSRRMLEPMIKEAEESYKHLSKILSGITPSVDLPSSTIFSESVAWVSPEITREKNAWERHKEIINISSALVEVSKQTLNEQRGNTKYTIIVLLLTVISIIIAMASLAVSIYK